MNKKQKKWLKRILVALAIFFAVMALEELGVLATIFGEPGALYASFALYRPCGEDRADDRLAASSRHP